MPQSTAVFSLHYSYTATRRIYGIHKLEGKGLRITPNQTPVRNRPPPGRGKIGGTGGGDRARGGGGRGKGQVNVKNNLKFVQILFKNFNFSVNFL